MHNLYTIGYSGWDIDNFIDTLLENKINALVDVRSSPYSKTFPAFNKDNLSIEVSKRRIYYIPMCEELGARPKDISLYSNGQVDFKKVANSNRFLNGCKRVHNGLVNYVVCLLCSEHDPLTCHRTILVAHNMDILYKHLHIFHIIGSRIEPHVEMEKRLLNITGCNQGSFLGPSGIEQAYTIQSTKIAYRKIEKDDMIWE